MFRVPGDELSVAMAIPEELENTEPVKLPVVPAVPFK
jgi:hypothetical protein